ncbi:AbrB/MazE/SpoVT family DNA-binding domain-containing protein [Acidaminobacter sp.]|uniref:AbrB/MazE/SpoVT family DNA-binding domain-containing protein n=1 Tax=Acidaminobacter sp. TaxID=1872102 RepID=UPI001385C93B|nr:AbrB/MazE/SpoVT family DNA-binding domain-containing protein [Acidaminobacter sp.]MDK9711187.1 AbrB/MazE/SpoVT family DNA-binding domain-containing protein [Acidaminobacter sp.]MZQ98210.1 AbrB/MazE/SpoVT family DNA-binding domain-containing protein [Acidaminobacter sp.]
MIATINKWGNGQGIRLPKAILELLGIDVNDPVEIEIEDNKIIISKISTSKELTLDDLFKDYTDDYKPSLIDWGKPKGDEIW